MHRQRFAVGRPVKVQGRAPLHGQRRRGHNIPVRRVGVHDEKGQALGGGGGDAQPPPVGRPLDIVGSAVGDGKGQVVDEYRPAHAGGGFQRLHADFGVAGGGAGNEGHGDAGAVGRPGGPAVVAVPGGGLRQDAGDAASGTGAGISNGAGGEGVAVAAVGPDGLELAFGVDVGDAVDGRGHRDVFRRCGRAGGTGQQQRQAGRAGD